MLPHVAHAFYVRSYLQHCCRLLPRALIWRCRPWCPPHPPSSLRTKCALLLQHLLFLRLDLSVDLCALRRLVAVVSSLDRSCYVSEKCLLIWGCTRGERRGNQTGNVGSFLDSSTSLLVGSGSFWRLGLVSCQGRSLMCSKIPSPHVLACLQLSSHPLVTQSAFRMGPRDPHGCFQVAY